MSDDVLRDPVTKARDARQQRRGGGVDVDADGVHAVFHDRIERARQFELRQIVLVLADADRLRIDLHELGERILQPPRDRDRAAQRHVEVRQFLARIFGGRID